MARYNSAAVNGKKPAPPTKPKPNRKRSAEQQQQQQQQPLEVYCRLRPLKISTDSLALRPISDCELQIALPNSTARQVYKFQRVFPDKTTQKTIFDDVAHPLVQNLVNGQNGLLFTYGVTSAGKTYTITGTPKCPGILPRVLDLLFNTLQNGNLQTNKFVFKPDSANGFDICFTADAILQEQKENKSKAEGKNVRYATTPNKRLLASPFTPRSRPNDAFNTQQLLKEWAERERDAAILPEINYDNNYAIFVSYVEIYQNYIYDLLDDAAAAGAPSRSGTPGMTPGNGSGKPSSKGVGEDAKRRTYVQSAVELEVRDANEAFDHFLRGHARRRIGATMLNAQSSRSHSVFTIRLVQAPLDTNGIEVLPDKRYLIVSQLSVVDLAGCERTGRTNAIGNRLREASSINNSLMTLRACFEALRENQKCSNAEGSSMPPAKMVPYRESKLTYLFKHYFEGDGAVKMILCLNPGAEDFDETLHVLKFGEQSQEIMTNKGRAAAAGRLLLRENNENPFSDILGPISFGPPYPKRYLDDPENDRIIPEWIDVARKRKAETRKAFACYLRRMADIRASISDLERDNLVARQDGAHLRMDLDAREAQLKELENRVLQQRRDMDSQQKRLEELRTTNGDLYRDLCAKQSTADALQRELAAVKASIATHLDSEKARLKNWCIEMLNRKQEELDREKCINKGKLEMVTKILTEDNDFLANLNVMSPPKETFAGVEAALDQRQTFPKMMRLMHDPNAVEDPATATCHEATCQGPPVANPRYATGPDGAPNDKWLEHRPPASTLDTGTILQPIIKNRKSITNLKSTDFTSRNFTKYAVTHHKATPSGDVETEVYKADVIPTKTGGAQVIFQDVETMKQSKCVSTPGATSNTRKRVAMFEAAAATSSTATPTGISGATSSTGTPTTTSSTSNNQHAVSKRARRAAPKFVQD